MMKNDTDFYKNLDLHKIPLRKLLKDEHLFNSIPINWYVVVTDIKDSTAAINKGLHNDVNLVATGSVITVLNAIKTIDNSIRIPYFFGGDGASFIIPESIIHPIMMALDNYSVHVKSNFQLALRVGKMKMDDVYEEGNTLKVAKLKINKLLTTPVVLGNGLKFVERSVKDAYVDDLDTTSIDSSINLEGMECRWNQILPSSEEKKVICLLVICKVESRQAEVFTKIIDEIDRVFGNLSERTPITTFRLKLNTSIEKIKNEMYARLGRFNRIYLLKNWLLTVIGKYYFKFFKGGKEYLSKLTQLSDTIMLDGSINTVFTGTQNQINQLKLLLDSLENEGEIIYGMHATYASIMSCYVEDRDKKHIHFVDGTEGGYTSAANQIKRKLKAS